jgi:hypothetical protein
VLWNALAPELWRRTTIALQRALARLVGLQEAELRRLVRISYAKVAEFQRRGAIHFHAVLRLDAATECRCPGCLAPPPAGFTAELLEEAIRQAATAVTVPCPALEDGGPERYARWGDQLDVHNITRDHNGDGEAGELSAEQVAGYIAKYATKATESFGSGLDRRLGADDLDHLEGLGAHAGVPGSLVDQEPPLLDHLHRPAPGPGRLRQAPPGQGRRALGCLGPTRGRPGGDRGRLLGVRRLGL